MKLESPSPILCAIVACPLCDEPYPLDALDRIKRHLSATHCLSARRVEREMRNVSRWPVSREPKEETPRKLVLVPALPLSVDSAYMECRAAGMFTSNLRRVVEAVMQGLDDAACGERANVDRKTAARVRKIIGERWPGDPIGTTAV